MKDDDGAKYPMVAVDAALAIVLEHTAPLPTERVPLLEHGTAPALRRCLAERIEAAAPFPRFRAAISDGYCCKAIGEAQTLHDDGSKQLAGTSATLLRQGACRYITTGAPLPDGSNAVAKQEHCARNGAEVSLPALKPGADVREVGSDWALGDELCSASTPLTPSDIAILAAAGHDSVEVYRRPRVRVFSSGAELHVDGPFDATRQIKDANRAGLIALLSDGSAFGGNAVVEDGGVLPDDLDAWTRSLGDALKTCDVVVTTGGASVGRADFAKKALEGASRSVVRFGRLHMKPGKPTTFATLDSRSFLDDEVEGEKRWAFALPGNPVSALTTASLLVVPCLKRLQGVARSRCAPCELPVTLSSPVSLDAVRPEFHRVALSLSGEDGNAEPYRVRQSGDIVAASTGVQRSSRLLSMRGAHALACLPERGRARLVAPGATSSLPAGTTVPGLLIAAPPPLVAGAPFLSAASGVEATTPPPAPPIDGVVVAVAIVGGEEPADARAAAATAGAEIVAAATGLRAATRPPIRCADEIEAVARDAAVVVACGGLGLAPREPCIAKALSAHRRAPGLARAMALASSDALEAPAAAIVGNALVLVVPEASAAACVRSVAKALPAIVSQLPVVEDSVVEHAGGCHCKAVRFRVRAPRHLVTWDCNCSICHMKRNTHFIVPASDFFLDAGEDNLSEYRFGTGVARHRFCSKCGVQAFYHPRSNPDGVAVTVHCLDPGSVSSVEVRKFDGTDWAGSYAATGIAACSKKA